MKAVVWQGPERMEIGERPEPADPAPDEVVMRPGAVGICGSEVEGYLGHMGNRTPPLVMGHEFAGEVIAAGAGAERWIGTPSGGQPDRGVRALPAVPRRPGEHLPRADIDRRPLRRRLRRPGARARGQSAGPAGRSRHPGGRADRAAGQRRPRRPARTGRPASEHSGGDRRRHDRPGHAPGRSAQ